jgi:hypothetical protein
MTATLAEPVRDFGTGLLHTTVRPLPDGGHRWRRSPGPLSPAPFVPTGAFPDRPAAVAGVRWVVGTADGDDRIYDVRNREAVAGRLLREGPDQAFAQVLHGLGAALRALHEQPAPADLAPPRGLARFATWLDGRAPDPRVAYAESLLRPRLGIPAWKRVRALAERIPVEEAVLSHGAPGLGSLVIAEAGEGADALAGEDVCRAPWWFDLGWALGELVELQWYLGGDKAAWQRLITALLDGYGRELPEHWRSLVAFRVLLHAHDYTAYVGWEPKVFDKYTGFARYLLSV